MTPTDDTKTNIQNAARSLFGQKGFAGTSMSQIAEEAGIKKASLYYFFDNKEALYVSLIEDVMETVSRELTDLMQTDPQPKLRDVLEALMRTAIDKHLFVPGPDPSVVCDPEMQTTLQSKKRDVDEVFVKFLTTYDIQNPELAAYTLMQAMHGYVKECACREPEISCAAYAAHLASLYTNQTS
jgi:AcrR family transcriptional regulator